MITWAYLVPRLEKKYLRVARFTKQFLTFSKTSNFRNSAPICRTGSRKPVER